MDIGAKSESNLVVRALQEGQPVSSRCSRGEIQTWVSDILGEGSNPRANSEKGAIAILRFLTLALTSFYRKSLK